MTDIEKALAMIAPSAFCEINVENVGVLARAFKASLKQHEAFKQEVSDAAEEYNEAAAPMGWEGFDRFIIPKAKPDPLREIAEAWGLHNTVAKSWVEDLRATLEARGFEIREKKDD